MYIRYPVNWGMHRRPSSWMQAKQAEAEPRVNKRQLAHVFGTARDALLKMGETKGGVNVLISGPS